jgi:anti-sigma regulatory factor (Ser/Thr protein kinase)
MRVRDYGQHTKDGMPEAQTHDLIKPGGLGLRLIRRAFDNVDYILKARGTELVMTKKLNNLGPSTH